MNTRRFERRKYYSHNPKYLRNANGAYRTEKKPLENIPDFVVNKLSEVFAYDELVLLKKGLNYATPDSKKNLEDTIIDIEGAIEYLEKDD